jgi:hypothetical protein
MRLIRFLPAAAAAVCFALPGSAAAAGTTTFCVNAQDCPADGFKVTMATALSASRAGAGPATILIGPNPDGSPYAGPFAYSSGAATDNSIKIVGQGRPEFTSNADHKAVIELHGPARNTVQGIDVRVPALDSATGLLLDGAAAGLVHVTGENAGVAFTRGIALGRGGELLGVTVTMPTGFGVELTGGPTTIDGSSITAPFGVIGGAADLRLDHSRIRAAHTAIQMIGSSGGDSPLIDDGLLAIGSEISTTAADGNAVFLRDAPARFIRATIAGRGAGKVGIKFDAVNRVAKLGIKTSVIGGYDKTLVRTTSLTGGAPIDIEDSEWLQSGNDFTGFGEITTSGSVDAEPRFVDPVAGDLRLRGGDRAIDLNHDVPADTISADDLLGRLAVDGNGDGVKATDAGALEYLRLPPEIGKLESPATVAVGAPAAFGAGAADADGEAVELHWDFGDGSGAAGGSATHAYPAPGTYTVKLTARDEAGVESSRTATIEVPAPASGGDTPAPHDTTTPPDTTPPGTTPTGTTPAGDTIAPRISSARLTLKRSAVRRGRKARLTIKLSEAAKLRITPVRRTTARAAGKAKSTQAKAGRSARTIKLGHRHIARLAKRRELVKIVAIDAAGNRSKPKLVRLTITR